MNNVKRVVWRMTSDKPTGEVVAARDAQKTAEKAPDQAERTRGGWTESSYDLLHGVDVQEVSDTIPADLFLMLFAEKVVRP